ncbi:hypothetical protein ZHAS_00020474 [Anopheles sinensis]|uniref:Uncharacterized protein n=1 Tax=Anopheles sinensis TaxID=74873 RepID=A0A084WPK4_ANOSI|nr:hypothetical protein ZHAS_00020474 [Anopheles sinensis]
MRWMAQRFARYLHLSTAVRSTLEVDCVDLNVATTVTTRQYPPEPEPGCNT